MGINNDYTFNENKYKSYLRTYKLVYGGVMQFLFIGTCYMVYLQRWIPVMIFILLIIYIYIILMKFRYMDETYYQRKVN